VHVQWGGPTLMRPPVVKRQTPPRSGLANFLPLRVQAARRAPLAPSRAREAGGARTPRRAPGRHECRAKAGARCPMSDTARARGGAQPVTAFPWPGVFSKRARAPAPRAAGPGRRGRRARPRDSGRQQRRPAPAERAPWPCATWPDWCSWGGAPGAHRPGEAAERPGAGLESDAPVRLGRCGGAAPEVSSSSW